MTNFVVAVYDGDIYGALARFKKATMRTGLLREVRLKASFTAPSLARRRKSLKARKRAAKDRKRALLSEQRGWGQDA